MKILIPIVIGLLVVGCGEKQSIITNKSNSTPEKPAKQNVEKENPSKELTLKERVVGTYEYAEGKDTAWFTLLENGLVEGYEKGKKVKKDIRWKISNNRELHFVIKDGGVKVFSLNPDDGLTRVKYYLDKKSQMTFHRVTKSENPAEDKTKSVKGLPLKEMVPGTYVLREGDYALSMTFLENGLLTFGDEGEDQEGSWKIAEQEVHVGQEKNDGSIFRRNPDGRMTLVGTIYNKDRNRILKKRDSIKRYTLAEKLVGTYEYTASIGAGRLKRDATSRIVLQEMGVFEAYQDFPGPKGVFHSKGKGKWKVIGKEVHSIKGSGNVEILRINSNWSLTYIADIKEGSRIDLPKEQQITTKKIK